MLAGMFKIENNRYYLYCNSDNSYSIVCSNKDGVRCLNENEANDLINNLFTTDDIKYFNSFYNYDVYTDTVSNYRFFKNGKEDLSMFFKYNGVDAVMCDESDADSNSDDDTNAKKVKVSSKSVFNKKTLVDLILCEGLLFSIVIPILLHESGRDYRLLQKVFPKDISASKAIELIEDSKHLNEHEKEVLANYEALDAFINYTNEERNYELNARLTNIDIKTYGKFNQMYKITNGYYSPSKVNNIYINADYDNQASYDDTLTHEFVHLMQNSYCDYLYIHEACAEILSYEYYDCPMNSYTEEIKRVKALMEIIDPEIIMNCNFNDDYSSFEDEIYKYLDGDDADKLLDCFKTTGIWLCKASEDEENKLNENIDGLLKKMYFNKYGTDISESKIINRIYDDLAPERIYFNSNHPNYNNIIYYPDENGEVFKDEPVFSDDDYCNYILDKNNINKIVYKKVEGIREEDYETDSKKPSVFLSEYRLIEGAREEWETAEKVNDNGVTSYNSSKVVYYDGVKYSYDEAYDNGLFEEYYLYYNDIEVNDYKDIVPSHGFDKIIIYGNDGSYCEMENYDNQWHPHKKYIPINKPTLPINNSNNKSKDRFAGIDFDENNEVKVEFTTNFSK